jgi:hypothetical protein
VERRDALQALLALRRTQQDRQGPT